RGLGARQGVPRHEARTRRGGARGRFAGGGSTLITRGARLARPGGRMLFHLFHALRDTIPGANVFRYVSTPIRLPTLTSLLTAFVVAPWFTRRARERQLGEVIRDDGPATHAGKRGTPTMGGALIILALVAATVLWCDLHSTLVWLALLVTVGYGAIGFVD